MRSMTLSWSGRLFPLLLGLDLDATTLRDLIAAVIVDDLTGRLVDPLLPQPLRIRPTRASHHKRRPRLQPDNTSIHTRFRKRW